MIMAAVAFLLGLILCLLFGVPYIDWLKKHMIGQYIKDVAPEAHAKKQGTPTTGGVFIITAAILASIVVLMMAQRLTTTAFIVLITFLFYTLAGFQDDYIKLKGKGNDGLSPRGKLLRQIAIALLPAMYVMMNYTTGSIINFGHFELDLKWLYPFFAIFVITGASNAYNLTDGLDGLAAATGMFPFAICSIIALYSGYPEVAIISAAVAGTLVGFLRYNKPKAQVFMGDTGSLAIGGLLGTLAVMGKFEILLIFLGAVFVIETLSVIIQVTSYKLTGKRVFKMSPIHHHFELCNWSEKKIVVVFSIFSLICSLIAAGIFYLTMKGFI